MSNRSWADIEAEAKREEGYNFLAKLIVGLIVGVIAIMALTASHDCAPDDTEIECRNIP